MLEQELTFDYRDEFGRRDIAEKIKSLLEGDIDISPMLLDGGWGAGKSEFCQKLVNLINSEEEPALKAIYIDAFEADHADEPLLTILSSILNAIDDPNEKNNLKDRALPVLRYALGAAMKIGASALLSRAGIGADAVIDEIQNASNELIDKSVSRLLKDHEKVEESLNALKALLTTVGEEQPLVIFVDELDRCRPDYTVTMLENIKHIFDVDNIQFVLVANSKQICSSVKHRYGIDDEDAQKYLDKFIKYTIQLPEVCSVDNNSILASQHHYNLNIDQSEVVRGTFFGNEGCISFVNELIEKNKLSLRDVDKFIRLIEVSITLNPTLFVSNLIFPYGLLRVYGVFLYCFDPVVAEVFCNNEQPVEEMIRPLTDANIFGDFDDWPSHAEVIAAGIMHDLFGMGYAHVGIFDQNHIEKWREAINHYFRGRGTNKIKCVKDSISLLKLV